MESNLQESIREREDTLLMLDKHMRSLSTFFRKCFLEKGRGALVVYTYPPIEKGYKPNAIDYYSKKESVALFDAKNSKRKLAKMIDGYDGKSEGIMVLITKSNATWFITVKLKSLVTEINT